MKNLKLEVNSDLKQSNDTFSFGKAVIMMTPAINEDYFLFRVKVHKDQSIVGFPKFGTIGIGFAKEEDWNTNLPYSCEANEIYEHIKHNKKFKSISKETCIEAITMIQEAAKKYKESK